MENTAVINPKQAGVVPVSSVIRDERPPGTPYSLVFSGSAGEYFKIWIVNIALSILTLGIYSAWAKVRTKKYLYGNTSLAGASFDWDASPIAILKGRAIAVAIIVLFTLVGQISPAVMILFYLALVPLYPWVVVRSMIFNLRHTNFRNVRFGFNGQYGEAFKVYILWGLVIVLSLGLAYPFVAHRMRRFITERSRYGATHLSFHGDIGFYYIVYVVAYIVYIGAFLVMALGIGGAAVIMGPDSLQGEDGSPPVTFIALIVLLYALLLVAIALSGVAIQTFISNHAWRRTRMGPVGIYLDLNIWRMLWLTISNLFLIVISVGLLIPWATIRTLRYTLSRFTLYSEDSLDAFVAGEDQRAGAFGEEFGDAMDFDIGI